MRHCTFDGDGLGRDEDDNNGLPNMKVSVVVRTMSRYIRISGIMLSAPWGPFTSLPDPDLIKWKITIDDGLYSRLS